MTATLQGELLGVHNGVALEWYHVSPDDKDIGPRENGLETSLLVLRDETQRVGSLRISWVTPDSEQCLSTGLKFLHKETSLRLPEDAPLTKIWRESFNYARTAPPSLSCSYYNFTEQDAPSEEVMLSDLEYLSNEWEEARLAYLTWARVPFIVFARIDEPYQNQGLGKAMYIAAAKKLATHGRMLRGGQCQSVAAQRVWNSLRRNGYPVKDITLSFRGRDIEYQALDYT